jgi:TRAP transporter TAXI family solute receptor
MKRVMVIMTLLVGIFGGVFFSGVAISAPQKQTVQILGCKQGFSCYVLTFALAEQINKTSSWLQAAGIEAVGSVANVKTLFLEPETRGKFLVWGSTISYFQAMTGQLPGIEGKKYTSYRMVISAFSGPTTLVTLDPKIKTIYDLVGKRVAVPREGTSMGQLITFLLKEGLGLWDKMKIEFIGTSGAGDALKDGLVDVAYQPTVETTPGVFRPAPSLEQLIASKKTYFIDIPKEAVGKAQQNLGGVPIFWVEAPIASLGKNQTNPLGMASFMLGWYADVALGNDIVYEICRVVYDNAEAFGGYHATGKSITKGSLAGVPVYTEKDFHPGAVKFYKEHGVKIGGE